MRDQSCELSELTPLTAADRFESANRVHHLGTSLLFDVRTSALRYDRTASHVARSHLDHYHVLMYLGGSGRTWIGARETLCAPGDIGIIDMACASRTIVSPRPGSLHNHHVTFLLPRTLLAPLLAAPDGVGAQVIAHDSAYGGVLASHFLAVRRHAPLLSLGELESAVRVLAMLVATAVKPAPGTEHLGARTAAAAKLVAIKRHLDQPRAAGGVEIEDVCRTFGVSRASLYRMFEPDGGIVAYVRQRQLRRAFAALISPASRHRRIFDLALQHGFQSESAFIRAFRRSFGVTPGDLRAAARERAQQPRRGEPTEPVSDATLVPEVLSWIRELETALPLGDAPAETPGR